MTHNSMSLPCLEIQVNKQMDQGHLRELVPSCHMDFGDLTQAISLGGRGHPALNHLMDPCSIFETRSHAAEANLKLTMKQSCLWSLNLPASISKGLGLQLYVTITSLGLLENILM